MIGCPCCQLHLHSRKSFKDGLYPIEEMVERAAEIHAITDAMPGIGLTDHGVLFAAPELFSACTKYGIKGMIGMEAYEAVPHAFDIERDGEVFKIKWADLNGQDRYYHLTLWALNKVGWINLVALHTQSFSPEYHPSQRGKPLVDRESLARHSEGLLVGMGCMASRVNVNLARDSYDVDKAYEHAKWYKEVFGDRFIVEVMANLPEQQALLRPQRLLARKLGAKTVAMNDVHYRDRIDGIENGAHHTMVKSRAFKKADTEVSADKADDGFGQWYGSDGFYLKTGDEMLATGGLERVEIERTLELLDRCDFVFRELPEPKPPVPVIPGPGEDPDFDSWLKLNAEYSGN